jgi:hypothetical protein
VLPTSWLSLAFFAVLVVPGLLFDLLLDRRRVGPRETTFREISRVVLASGIFSTVGLGVLAGVARLTSGDWVPDVTQLLGDDANAYIARHIGTITLSLAIMCTSSALAAGLSAWWVSRKNPSRLDAVSSWTSTFRPIRKVGWNRARQESPYVRVRLSNGTVYKGHVAGFTADLELADRELVLGPPISIKRALRTGEEGPIRFQPVGPDWQRLILKADDIESIFVRYEQDQDEPRHSGRQIFRYGRTEEEQLQDTNVAATQE